MNNLHHPYADDDFVESSIDLGRGSNQWSYLIRKIGQTVAVELIRVHFFTYLRNCVPVVHENLSAFSPLDRNRLATFWGHVVMVDTTFGLK